MREGTGTGTAAAALPSLSGFANPHRMSLKALSHFVPLLFPESLSSDNIYGPLPFPFGGREKAQNPLVLPALLK